MTAFTVAAERAGELRSRSIRPAARIPKRVPAGTSHAVAPGADTTACGLAIAGLELFPDIIFLNASFLARCYDCQKIVKPT